MAASPLTYSDLPDVLPVFPLTGALLLPGGQLPLNIFEPRYLTMFSHAMGTPHRLIGMVQARERGASMGEAEIYKVGCAGRLTAFSETDDGRYLVTLSGIIRFDVLQELDLHAGGYRQVTPDFLSYDHDMTPGADELDGAGREDFLANVRAYFDAQGFDTDWDAVNSAPLDELVPSLAMACPFTPAEKQALLEAPSPRDRMDVLSRLFRLSAASPLDSTDQAH